MNYIDIEKLENLLNWLRVVEGYTKINFHKDDNDKIALLCKKGNTPVLYTLEEWFEEYEQAIAEYQD